MTSPLDRAMREQVDREVGRALEHLRDGWPSARGGRRIRSAAATHVYHVLPSAPGREPVRRSKVSFKEKDGAMTEVLIEEVRPQGALVEFEMAVKGDKAKAEVVIARLKNEPRKLATEIEDLLVYLLDVGVTREELMQLVDAAVVRSVLES